MEKVGASLVYMKIVKEIVGARSKRCYCASVPILSNLGGDQENGGCAQGITLLPCQYFHV